MSWMAREEDGCGTALLFICSFCHSGVVRCNTLGEGIVEASAGSRYESPLQALKPREKSEFPTTRNKSRSVVRTPAANACLFPWRLERFASHPLVFLSKACGLFGRPLLGDNGMRLIARVELLGKEWP